MFRCIVSALDLILARAPCRAEEGTAFIYSYGVRSSGAFVAAYGKNLPGQAIMTTDEGRNFFDESASFMNWLLGYLSAVNVMRGPGKPMIQQDNAGIDLWIRNWWNAHPTQSMFDGARPWSQSTGNSEPPAGHENPLMTAHRQTGFSATLSSEVAGMFNPLALVKSNSLTGRLRPNAAGRLCWHRRCRGIQS
jgi:hypothetical protein